jgi:5-methylcytosine-specific restriction protein B
MSRYNPSRNIAPILDATQQWIQRCLIQQRSLFTDRYRWRIEDLALVRSAFTDNPDASDASFIEKLEGQLASAPPATKQLMAELLWVLMLFQSNIRPLKKRESISLVWGWSGEELAMDHPLLSDEVLIGVGSPGTAYNTQRWRELNYLIGLIQDLAGRPEAERNALLYDRDSFERWISDAPQEGYRQFRHLFRYLAFPDQNERITLGRDRWMILAAFKGLDPADVQRKTDAEQDDLLSELRQELKARHSLVDLDFYEDRFADQWKGVNASEKLVKTADGIEAGYALLKERFLRRFPGFDSFSGHLEYRREERDYKDELVAFFETTVKEPLGTAQWARAGEEAVKLLKRPLKGSSGRPQNIVGWRYIELLSRLDPDQMVDFGRALGDLLRQDEGVGQRVDGFVQALLDIVGEDRRVLPAAQRSITSFYLAVGDPSSHMFCKTAEMQRVLRVLDSTFQWTGGRLTGADMERVEGLAGKVFTLLELEGWEPADYIDVQSFLWVAANHGDHVSEPTDEDTEENEVMTIDKPSLSAVRPPLNQILFGPPGTGKTFHAVNKALEILDPVFAAAHSGAEHRLLLKRRFDELVESRRIRFVTFHQSFSYEDFVEGLRADVEGGEQLSYRVEPGVFREICVDAEGSMQAASSVGIRDGARIWKVSIDGTGPSPTRDYCLANDQARIGWGEVGDLQDEGLPEVPAYSQLGSNDRNTLHAFSNEMERGDVVLCIGSATHVQAIGVVQGEYTFEQPVVGGVRKDYQNVLPVRWLAAGLSLDLRALNGGRRFTLKTVYEITRFNWPELAAVIDAASIVLRGSGTLPLKQPQDHVLIIDEINRGNVSRIFGELITLVEPSKRAGAEEQLEVTLPYSKKRFSVPSSVYLIGTMNTADRSLSGLDTALRRRFEFVEMPPRPEALKGVVVAGIPLDRMLAVMNQRIEVLLDRDHQLGHAYFLSVRDGDDVEVLARIFRNQVLPLLQEYFFEDWQRIAWVLNDHRKAPGDRFLVSREGVHAQLFGTDEDVPTSSKLWSLNKEAFGRASSYLGIIRAGEV